MSLLFSCPMPKFPLEFVAGCDPESLFHSIMIPTAGGRGEADSCIKVLYSADDIVYDRYVTLPCRLRCYYPADRSGPQQSRGGEPVSAGGVGTEI